VRAQFIATEVGIGLRRNLTLTVAAIVTTAVSLALLGGGLLVRQQVAKINDLYYGKLEVAVYLDAAVTQDQRNAIAGTIAHDALVRDSHYESKGEAFTRFKEQNTDNPDLVQLITADTLPESYRIQLKDPRQYAIEKSRYESQAGVDRVYDYSAILQPIFRLLDGISRVAFIIAAIQVAASALLIYNTVRVSAFGRRRETGIMRLVGASSFSIQLPFLVEGAVAGLTGSVIACGALVASKHFIIDGIVSKSIGGRILPPLQWADITGAMPVLVVTGVGLSVVASFVTLRRFLRV